MCIYIYIYILTCLPICKFDIFFAFVFWWYIVFYASQGYKSGISRLLPSSRSQIESPQTSSAPCSTQENSPAPTVQTSFSTNPNRVNWNGQIQSSEFEDVDSGDNNPGAPSLTQPAFGSVCSLLSHGVAGKWQDLMSLRLQISCSNLHEILLYMFILILLEFLLQELVIL